MDTLYRDLFIIDTIARDYKCVIYLVTVIRNRRAKESLAISKKWPKIHFEEKILAKSMSTFKL